MGLRINQNIAAMNAYRNLSITSGQMEKSLERLSSGFRINRAADDAAGLAISEGLRSQVAGLKVASRNAQDGISLVQTAEGALQATHALLQRIRELAVAAANTGGNDVDARTALETEATQAVAELDRIADSTMYGKKVLLDGTNGGGASFDFQVGATSLAADQVSFTIDSMKAADLGVDGVPALILAGDVTALDDLDAAISTVSTTRATLGGTQNRLEYTVNNLSVSIENLAASESRIRDTDMAMEMVAFTRAQILSQAGTAMLAQANMAPQSVLQLLGG